MAGETMRFFITTSLPSKFTPSLKERSNYSIREHYYQWAVNHLCLLDEEYWTPYDRFQADHPRTDDVENALADRWLNENFQSQEEAQELLGSLTTDELDVVIALHSKLPHAS